MKFEYCDQILIGTRAEILEKIETAFVFTLKDNILLLGEEEYSVFDGINLSAVKEVLVGRIRCKVPQDTFDIKIGNIDYNGTKEEIKIQFLMDIEGVDVRFKGNDYFELLGVRVFGHSDETISSIRNRIIKKMIRMIDEI